MLWAVTKPAADAPAVTRLPRHSSSASCELGEVSAMCAGPPLEIRMSTGVPRGHYATRANGMDGG